MASLVDGAADRVAQLYRDQPEAQRAELQFAIYPFRGGGSAILDIERTGDGFRAADIQGSGVAVSGDSLDALIEEAARLPEHDDMMFRWIRPVRDLRLPDERPTDPSARG